LRRIRGRLIAIEGIDQSGKRTQSTLLAKEFRTRGLGAAVWNFPDYSTQIGKQLRAYLDGRNPLDYHAVHLLYAANKWERIQELDRLLASDCTVIVNRYSPSNLAYGAARGLPLSWLKALENGLPIPDIVIVLDIAPQISFKRKATRRDLHEADRQYLTRVRSTYIRLARQQGWKVVNAQQDPKSVHAELWSRVSDSFRARSWKL
jgi:dTMP kinase